MTNYQTYGNDPLEIPGLDALHTSDMTECASILLANNKVKLSAIQYNKFRPGNVRVFYLSPSNEANATDQQFLRRELRLEPKELAYKVHEIKNITPFVIKTIPSPNTATPFTSQNVKPTSF